MSNGIGEQMETGHDWIVVSEGKGHAGYGETHYSTRELARDFKRRVQKAYKEANLDVKVTIHKVTTYARVGDSYVRFTKVVR